MVVHGFFLGTHHWYVPSHRSQTMQELTFGRAFVLLIDIDGTRDFYRF